MNCRKTMQTWMKLSRVLKVIADTKKITTFVSDRKEIPFDRVVDSTTLLTMATNPRYQERIELMDAKIERLKVPTKTKVAKSRQTASDMPSLESLQ